ncbi:MAG: SpoIIE family protein phosphatase [Sedimentisphaerales bacterium]|nr:SpoIIE family protein phosphatase [Sedimentisphaerales bacterium]
MEKTKEQIERDEQIYQLTTLVAGKFSPQEVLDKLAEAAVKIIGVKACSIRLLDTESSDLKMRSTYGLSEEYRNKGVVSKNDPVIKAAFEGEAIVLDDMRVDDRIKYKDATVKEGLVSQLTVAMQFQGRAIGVIRLYSPEPKRFDKDDIRLARAVASQCAVAITNAKLYARAIEGARIAEQMRLAGLIQRKMIPETAPRIPGVDIATTYIPCFDVGGDFYDFQKIGHHRIAIAIADVMGKGIPAALMMSGFRSAVRAYSDFDKDGMNILDFIKKINRMICAECKNGEFITFFYAVIDAREKTIVYCNCGHEPTILLRRDYAIDLNKGGMVLGVDPNAEYEIDEFSLEADDCLLFYTDGLIDAANFDGDMWGKTNLIKTTKNFCSLSAEMMGKNILSYRRRFVGLADQVDDTSFIIVKVGDIS